MKKPKAIFTLQNGGGSYKLEIYLIENATENQNNWADSQNTIIFDYQVNAIKKDLQNDGFIVKIIR